VNYEKDEVYGTVSRRTLAYTHPFDEASVPSVRPVTPIRPDVPVMDGENAHAFGPEAEERAQMMAYERNKLIQQESPYIREQVEVVEHQVHDYRLYIGMWIVAGVSAVAAFLTFSLSHVVVAAGSVAFALMSTPGRQYRDDD
jgi:hypothetical protein